MISNINLIFARADAYTALVGGNDGENELVISCSPGQDGNVVLSFVAMSVDGGAKRLEPNGYRSGSRKGFPLVRINSLVGAMRAVLLDWAHGGIPPTAEERHTILQQVQGVVETIEATWGIHEVLGEPAQAREPKAMSLGEIDAELLAIEMGNPGGPETVPAEEMQRWEALSEEWRSDAREFEREAFQQQRRNR